MKIGLNSCADYLVYGPGPNVNKVKPDTSFRYNWAGPSGMGPPDGPSDWSAMVHDYNFEVNGIYISSYFNPSIKKATAKALIQSNNNLIRNARGIQKLKFGLVFGIVNAFQSYVQSLK